MVIDINAAQPGKPRNSGAGDVAAEKKSPANNASTTDNASTSHSADTIELSAQAQELTRIQQSLQNLPQVDEARVNKLIQQIANGEYTVDAASLADKILADDKNFNL
jgi:negative regulator of flagellin synthesis FlgM